MNTQRGVTSRWGIPPNPISLTFFGAKKEAKKHPPPPRPPPIWGGCNTKSRRNRRLFSVLVSRDTRYIFYHGSQSLCPFGASHDLLHPRFRRPRKGAHGKLIGRCCFQETFRTRRSLEEFYFFEAALSLGL